MGIKTRVFCHAISQRSCQVEHSTYTELTNIKWDWACPRPNGRPLWTLLWNTGVLSNDIVAILPCTAIHLQPKCSNAFYVQWMWVSSCFFNIILLYKQVYFTLMKCKKCAYNVILHCKECALKHGFFFSRYRSDPTKHRTLPVRSWPIEIVNFQ